jgi:hypothetical protein
VVVHRVENGFVSSRHKRILILLAGAIVLFSLGWCIWPTGDPRVVGAWRHAEPGWEETYRFESNGRGTSAYEGEIERSFRWHVKDDRLIVRYFVKERTSFLPTIVLDWWDQLADDYSMTLAEEWQPLESGSRPDELIRRVHSPTRSNPIQLRTYRRLRSE